MIRAGLAPLERLGYSYESEARQATETAYDLLDQAEKLKEHSSWKGVIDISQAIIEEMVPALEYIDDSGGDVDGAIYSAIDLLWEASEQPLDAELQTSFFNWCMHSIRGDTYEGWDAGTDLMAIAVRLAYNREQVSDIETFLDERIETFGQYVDNFGLRYNLEHAVSLKITLLRNDGRSEEAKTLMEEYRYLPRVLEMLLDSQFKEGAYARVEELAQHAIEEQDGRLTGLVSGWLEWLVKVAEAKGEDDLLKQRLEKLLYNTPNMENFRRFKSAVPEEHWPQACDKVIAELKKKNRFFSNLPEIYEEENRMEELLAWLKENPGFNELDRFGYHFKTSHTEVIFSIYEELIRDLLANNTGRNYYRKVARTLSKLSESGFSKEVPPLVKDLKEEYYYRPALQDEFRVLNR